MDFRECLTKMKSPNQQRRTFRGGIIQIMITRACDEACCHCSSGSSLGGRNMVMTPEQFELACDSLATYWGVRACFGGNPAAHGKFAEICEIVKAKIPYEHSGIWCNNPLGKAHLMRGVFRPEQSNLNVHGSRQAYDEFASGWKDCVPFLKGLDPEWPEAKAIQDQRAHDRRVGDSRHSPPFVAPCDLGYTEEEIWDRASRCPCNQEWSALIGVVDGRLVGFWCEEAAHQAMLHEANPDWRGTGKPLPRTGIDIASEMAAGVSWWDQSMEFFEDQVRAHCPACGLCLNGFGKLAVGDNVEQYTKTHAFIMRPKRAGRVTQLVTSREEIQEGGVERMTRYIQNSQLPIVE